MPSCICCQGKVNYVDYKQTDILRKFVSAQFKILSSARTGLCKKHQRMVANAIKLARYMALMPYTKGQTIKK
jgi:small subunit ribosomal protein S18